MKTEYSKAKNNYLNSNINLKMMNDSGKEEVTLFTIGYEGISQEVYMRRLIEHGIKLLADVRYNPFSRKPGFSKKKLEEACRLSGIEYVHIPKLGIPGAMRKNIEGPEEIEKLFEYYRDKLLPDALPEQHFILESLRKYKRIALTCFEADVNQCHRKYTAEAVLNLAGFEFEILHI